jgi:hypothetical protein
MARDMLCLFAITLSVYSSVVNLIMFFLSSYVCRVLCITHRWNHFVYACDFPRIAKRIGFLAIKARRHEMVEMFSL